MPHCSNKGWPVGITEATSYQPRHTRGNADLIEAHNYILFEQASHRDKRDVTVYPWGCWGKHSHI